MGKKKPREKTAADLKVERVNAALEETDRSGRAPAFVRENPGQFLRDMYEVWHLQGGKEGGRWRNSIRKMRDEWLIGRNAVPSLHPKLMGRVKATRADARALIDLFLTRWRYGEGDDALSSMTRDGYVGFDSNDLKRLRGGLLASLFRGDNRNANIAIPEQANGHDDQEETRKRWVDVEKILYECDALIALSRHKIAVGPGPWQTINNVWHQLNHLWEYDQRNEASNRVLIWVIDLGSREVEQPEAFEEYFNSGLLALQLASFAKFDSRPDGVASRSSALLPVLRIPESIEREQRWQWLSERTVIVAQNIRLEELDAEDKLEDEQLLRLRLKDIGVTGEHVLPSTTPRAWGRELRQLYRKEIAASDATFTVFLRESPWLLDDRQRNIRYFAHTPLQNNRQRTAPAGESDWQTHSQELRAPDDRYDHAFRLVYWAARKRLGMVSDSSSSLGNESLAYLQKIGFRVLKLPTFLRIFSTGD